MSGSRTHHQSVRDWKVLSDNAIHVLRTRGDNPQLQNGYRAVSNTSYSPEDSVYKATVLLPDYLHSFETLKFLELNDVTAQLLWDQFCRDFDENPDWASVHKLARRFITHVPGNAWAEEDDWLGAFEAMGLSRNFVARIMDDEFKDMRLSGSAKQWVLEMMEMRFEFLTTIDAVIQTPPSKTIHRKVSKLDENGTLKIFGRPEIPPRSSSKVDKFGAPKPFIATEATEPPQNLDNHVVLWKGGMMSRLMSVHKEDRTLNFFRLTTPPPGDFNSRITCTLYFTKNEQVAWDYAQWRSQLADSGVVPMGILKVAIPKALLASSIGIFGEEWRNVVWAGRRGLSLHQNLRYLRDYQWMIGPICHQSNDQVARYNTMSELQIWKLNNNQTAYQHATSNESVVELLNEQCIGKVWIISILSRGAMEKKNT